MKLFPLTAFTCLTAVLLAAAAPRLHAQDKEKPDAAPPEEEPAEPQEREQLSPEELQQRLKADAELEKAEVAKMMKVFTTLEGSWTGRETLRYEENRLPEKSWKDEWEGKFTMGGRYFEMNGQTSGDDLNSAYRWICTYDVERQGYRAWYFGDNSQNEYTGKLSSDGKFVIWSIRSANGSESRFSMKADGNKVKCHGTDTLVDGSLFSTQSSDYTRKRVEL